MTNKLTINDFRRLLSALDAQENKLVLMAGEHSLPEAQENFWKEVTEVRKLKTKIQKWSLKAKIQKAVRS